MADLKAAARASIRQSKRILVVGGQSRAALAFRRRIAFDSDHALMTLVRRSCPTVGREQLFVVDNYFDPPGALLGEVDVVINFTGVTAGRDVDLLEEVNVKGPFRLAASAARNGVPHFIHLSSFHVYGYANWISRRTVEMPVAPYGRSKLRADKALSSIDSDGFAVSILRLPMLYGGGTGDNLRRLAALMMRINVIPATSSPALRSVLHVDNLAAVLETLSYDGPRGVCFAADADHFTIELLAETIGATIGHRPRLIRFPHLALLPLRIAARGLYSRLYESKFVLQSDCIVPTGPLPVTLRDGLKDLLSRERAQT